MLEPSGMTRCTTFFTRGKKFVFGSFAGEIFIRSTSEKYPFEMLSRCANRLSRREKQKQFFIPRVFGEAYTGQTLKYKASMKLRDPKNGKMVALMSVVAPNGLFPIKISLIMLIFSFRVGRDVG